MKKVKAFLISVSHARTQNEFMEGKGQVRNFAIIAYYEQEAVEKLMRHLTINLNYRSDNLRLIDVKPLRRTKKNAQFYTEEYYLKQEYVLNHFEEYKQFGFDKFYGEA